MRLRHHVPALDHLLPLVGLRVRRTVRFFFSDNGSGSGSGSIFWAFIGQCTSIMVFRLIPTLCRFILRRLTPNTCRIALLSKPLLVPSFRAAIIGPETHDRRLDLVPFIARKASQSSEDLVVIRQVAMRPPPRFHEQKQVCAVLHRRQHPRVGEVGVGPEGEGGELSHQEALHFLRVWAPFDRLQGAQATVRFFRSFPPPSAIGTMWSISKGPSVVAQ